MEFIVAPGLAELWLWKFARLDRQALTRIRGPQLPPLRDAVFPVGIVTSRPETRNTETPSNLSAARGTFAGPSSRPRRLRAGGAECGRTRWKNKPGERRALQRLRGQPPASGSARCPRNDAAPSSSRRSATAPVSR